MPTRLLRDGILTSDAIDLLDFPAEVFYRRLMSKVDDYGLFDARPSILRTSLYPLRVDRVREADIARWIATCEKAGVIALYSHGGKPFGKMLETRWQTRTEPKHPLPPWGKGEPLKTPVCNGEQPGTGVTVFGDVFGDVVAPDLEVGFDAFWSAWPSGARKTAKVQCREKWASKGCASKAEEVMVSLEAFKASADWSREGGRFIPAPLVWLNQDRWEAFSADDLLPSTAGDI